MSNLRKLHKMLRTKANYFMLLDALYSYLLVNDLPFEDFEIFVRKEYKPNEEFISKLCKIF